MLPDSGLTTPHNLQLARQCQFPVAPQPVQAQTGSRMMFFKDGSGAVLQTEPDGGGKPLPLVEDSHKLGASLRICAQAASLLCTEAGQGSFRGSACGTGRIASPAWGHP